MGYTGNECNPDCHWNIVSDNNSVCGTYRGGGVKTHVEHVRKTAVLGTDRVLRLELGS